MAFDFKKAVFIVLSLTFVISGFFFLNATDPNVRASASAYAIGSLAVLLGYAIYFKLK